ncbi:MAG: DUF2147 domain-containing protein [Granulosicoccus sp.]
MSKSDYGLVKIITRQQIGLPVCLLISSVLMSGFSLTAPAIALASTQAKDYQFDGYWTTSKLTSIVEINRCEDSLCAEIAWMWDVAVGGREMMDIKNSAQAKQKMPLVGLQLFSKFRKDGDKWRGRIYNPEDGRTYRAVVSVHSTNILRLKGCWGPFCLTRYWHRLRSIPIPTESMLDSRK